MEVVGAGGGGRRGVDVFGVWVQGTPPPPLMAATPTAAAAPTPCATPRQTPRAAAAYVSGGATCLGAPRWRQLGHPPPPARSGRYRSGEGARGGRGCFFVPPPRRRCHPGSAVRAAATARSPRAAAAATPSRPAPSLPLPLTATATTAAATAATTAATIITTAEQKNSHPRRLEGGAPRGGWAWRVAAPCLFYSSCSRWLWGPIRGAPRRGGCGPRRHLCRRGGAAGVATMGVTAGGGGDLGGCRRDGGPRDAAVRR